MLLVDLDILVYRIGFGCKDLDFVETTDVLDSTIKALLDRFPLIDSRLIISNTEKTFRHAIAKTQPYKGNRKAEKPPYYNEIREYMIDQWKAEMAPVGLEADDWIGINTDRKTDIIATIDKDMQMIPAHRHYNFVKDQLFKVRRPSYFFWHQVLVGDRADNILGLKGIGEVNASRLLDGAKTSEMRKIVEAEYQREFGDTWFDRFDENCRLLWIKRDLTKEYYHYV